MAFPKPDPLRRVVAVFIDGLIVWVVALVPVIGGLIGAAYMLTRDTLMYSLTQQEEWKNRSIGKKLMGLEVVMLDGGELDWADSAKRNLTLTIGSIISIIPVIGWFLGFVLALVLGIIELVLTLTDDAGRRYGDRWAGTQVIMSDTANVNSRSQVNNSDRSGETEPIESASDQS